MARGETESILSLLDRHGIKLSKAMGQNFLIDANIPEKIVRLSGIDTSCDVLEVGPGAGALTRELCKAAGFVTAVELDKRLLPLLRETLTGFDNANIVHGDILKLNIKELLEKNSRHPPRRRVCANLPYNITTPALTAFIGAGVFEAITVMVQREVARRICAKPGSPDYGAFTVFARYHTVPETLFDVPPECFMPRPSVWSSVITMKSRAERSLAPEAEPMFFRVVKAAFGQRRKTLVNALFAAFGKTLEKGEIAELAAAAGFDGRVRGETLGIAEFAAVSAELERRLSALPDNKNPRR